MLATLIRLLGSFDIAEEAMHDAFAAALSSWPRDGVPQNPRAWLISTGRFKAMGSPAAQAARFDAALAAAADQLEAVTSPATELDEEDLVDDRLRLIFTCCHPALTPDARIALTLREVCGLETEQIAHAFLIPAPTLAQRIVRAKGKIRDAHIPYQVPSRDELSDRLDTVLHVLYLVFNEGYSASSGDLVTRHDLSTEAIRLGRLLTELLPEPEAIGLLAMMLLHDARRAARTSPTGELISLVWSKIDELVESRTNFRGHWPGRASVVFAQVWTLHLPGCHRRGSRRRRHCRRNGLEPDCRALRRPAEGGAVWLGGTYQASPSPCATAPNPASPSLTQFFPEASSPNITSPTLRGPIFAAAWGDFLRQLRHTNARWNLQPRRQNGDLLSGDWWNWEAIAAASRIGCPARKPARHVDTM